MWQTASHHIFYLKEKEPLNKREKENHPNRKRAIAMKRQFTKDELQRPMNA